MALALAVLLLVLEVLLRIAGARYRADFWEAAGGRAVPDGSVTILALGESTTAGLWLPVEDSYPKQLERKLRAHYGSDRITVLMPPHIGQNTSQMVHRFGDYLTTFEPALVILMAGVNNTWSLAESNLGEFMPTGSWRTHAFRLRRWADDVKVFRLARLLVSGTGEAWRALRSDLAGEPRFTQWPPPDDPLVRGIGLEPFRRLWRSDVGRMIGEAKASGAGVILMTYPNYDFPPPSEFAALAGEQAVPLVENHRSFDPLIEKGRAEEFFFEDLRHPNAEGYAIVADNAFRAVLATGILDRSLGGRPPAGDVSPSGPDSPRPAPGPPADTAGALR